MEPPSVEPFEQKFNPVIFDITTPNEAENLIYDNDAVQTENDKGEQPKPEIVCIACNKKFTAKSSLQRHHERNTVCVNWISVVKSKPIDLDICIIDFIENLKNKITKQENTETICCKYCKISYSSIGNLNKHFKSATTCNRFAFAELENEIKKTMETPILE
jgi:hypothetical protein